MENNRYDILRNKIIGKLEEPVIESDKENISFYDLVEYSKETMGNYSKFIREFVKENTNRINLKSKLSSLLSSKGLFICSVSPKVSKFGEPSVEIVLQNKEGKYAGEMTIFCNPISFDITYRLNYYNKSLLESKKNCEFIRECFNTFRELMPVIDEFGYNNPDMAYSFDEDIEDSKLEVKDDIFRAVVDLNNLDKAYVSLDNLDDIVLATQNYKNNGQLYDYIEFYRNDYMKRINVNVNELNPTFKSIAKNYIKDTNEKKLIKK